MNNVVFNDSKLLQEISKNSRKASFEKEEVIVHPGQEILFVPIVQKGCIRILREDAEGRDVFLYHIYPGQTCAMSVTCCQTGKKSMIKALAEEKTEVLLIPVNCVESWFVFPEWKAFISNTYGTRFTELIQVIDLIAFSNMDKQLIHYLQERSKALGTKILEITHQQIADELHTHREGISRLLRTMERKKIVQLKRNSIRLLN